MTIGYLSDLPRSVHKVEPLMYLALMATPCKSVNLRVDRCK